MTENKGSLDFPKACNMDKKIEKLRSILKGMGKIVIAFSGGVDSSVVLKAAADTCGKDNVLAATACSPTYTETEKIDAEKTAKSLGIRHVFFQTEEFQNADFLSNPPERCFHCKKELLAKLETIRKNSGFDTVAEGSNKDDEKDFRPGNKAKEIFGVRSPLQEAGLTKDEIRSYARELGLDCWNKPSAACLASRIPYGSKITDEKLARIEKTERYLRKKGFCPVRVRDYGELARIEIPLSQMRKALESREKICRKLKSAGYNYVTLDMEGFRSGSMNLDLRKQGEKG